MMEKKKEENKGLYNGFDIDDGNDYYQLILDYISDPYYIEKGFGDPRNIDWDIGFLKKIIKILVRDHKEELMERVDDYTNFHLAASFIDNALMYSLLNKRDLVGQTEMINTFKNWQYIPFDIKLATLDTLFTEEDIDYSKHPFGVSKKQAKQEKTPPQKIIQFKPKQSQKPE